MEDQAAGKGLKSIDGEGVAQLFTFDMGLTQGSSARVGPTQF